MGLISLFRAWLAIGKPVLSLGRLSVEGVSVRVMVALVGPWTCCPVMGWIEHGTLALPGPWSHIGCLRGLYKSMECVLLASVPPPRGEAGESLRG